MLRWRLLTRCRKTDEAALIGGLAYERTMSRDYELNLRKPSLQPESNELLPRYLEVGVNLVD